LDTQANGGVPSFGHSTQLRVFVDPDLLQYDEVDEMCGPLREHGMTTSVQTRMTSCALPVELSPT
jgi:prolyl-tRNA editing enzyme YbaK/EbsC (Cys-tRNA(Pro) deacylase)